MSRIVTASIGSYLLQGWTLTDDGCPVCHTPRMRKPQSTELLCVSCNSTSSSTDASSTASAASTTPGQDTDASRRSGVSTPLTDPPSRSSTPDFPFVETPAMAARREATDRASSEIGRRLLQGWTMLAEACPNASCYTSPLMRKPATAGGAPSQMECVVCGRTYLSERDAAAQAVQAVPRTAAPAQVVPPAVTLAIPAPLASIPEVPEPKTTTTVSSSLGSISLTGLTSSTMSSAADSMEDAVQNMSRRLAQLTSAATVDMRAVKETTETLSGLLDVVVRMRTLPSR